MRASGRNKDGRRESVKTADMMHTSDIRAGCRYARLNSRLSHAIIRSARVTWRSVQWSHWSFCHSDQIGANRLLKYAAKDQKTVLIAGRRGATNNSISITSQSAPTASPSQVNQPRQHLHHWSISPDSISIKRQSAPTASPSQDNQPRQHLHQKTISPDSISIKRQSAPTASPSQVNQPRQHLHHKTISPDSISIKRQSAPTASPSKDNQPRQHLHHKSINRDQARISVHAHEL
ncbi:hypothetical protein RRG08_037991 [Elysia crispata]|uniref:Uncharacterized protein n=1 Tax=Elysia crispata TaxID=231223 RepID=A0AAE1DW02_9GAST|nr:hypothetical protein RRG08_037991 [Elysia crispata]